MEENRKTLTVKTMQSLAFDRAVGLKIKDNLYLDIISLAASRYTKRASRVVKDSSLCFFVRNFKNVFQYFKIYPERSVQL